MLSVMVMVTSAGGPAAARKQPAAVFPANNIEWAPTWQTFGLPPNKMQRVTKIHRRNTAASGSLHQFIYSYIIFFSTSNTTTLAHQDNRAHLLHLR